MRFRRSVLSQPSFPRKQAMPTWNPALATFSKRSIPAGSDAFAILPVLAEQDESVPDHRTVSPGSSALGTDGLGAGLLGGLTMVSHVFIFGDRFEDAVDEIGDVVSEPALRP